MEETIRALLKKFVNIDFIGLTNAYLREKKFRSYHLFA